MVDRPLMTRVCARGWLPRFSALLAWRGGERRMQRKQRVKSSPPLFRLRDVTLGGSTRAWRGGHAPEQRADVTLVQPGDMDKTFEQPADMTFGYVFKATCSTRP